MTQYEIASVMRQALEALEAAWAEEETSAKTHLVVFKAAASLRQAIACAEHLEAEKANERSEVEPVAWWIPKAEQFCLQNPNGERPFAKAWEPLYTHPYVAEQRQPKATQEPVAWLYEYWDDHHDASTGGQWRKNMTQLPLDLSNCKNVQPLYTHPQPNAEQEPVAEKVYDPEDDTAYIQYFIPHELIPVGTKFYTHPQPQREPLTDEQIKEALRKVMHTDTIAVVRAIEAAHGIYEGEA